MLRRAGREVQIEPQVFDLLYCLIERRGLLVRKEELLDQVWGDRFVSESALTTRIKSVRQAVGDDGSRQEVIRTVHGKGYEFIADVRVLDEAGGNSRASRSATSRSSLPLAMHPLVGRADLLALIEIDLANARLVTLVGTGGVGKTSVAYEVARRVAARYVDGVHVVELATVDGERAAVEAFATVLEVSTRQMASIEDAIVEALSGRRELLVLDNCEHVIEPVAALVGRILRSAPDVAVLATSREPLAVAGEHVRTVEPLPTGDLDQILDHELGSAPAVALFLERARAADPQFELDATTAPAVVEICRRLDGIPLAIELAASRASVIDVSEIAHRLDERFRLLTAVRRDVGPRHRTLHDAISWSYDLLDVDEQRLFASLAVFAGQFDLGAAEAICGGDVLDVLTRLTQRSMVAVRRPATGGTRYELLESLREYGRQRLDDHQSIELSRAHSRQFGVVARSVEQDLRGSHELDAVRRADGSFADLRAAQRFALDVGDITTGFGLICSLREYAMRTMHYEVFAWADSPVALTGEGHPLLPVVTGMRAYGAWVRGEFDSAVSLARAARAIEVATGASPSGLAERVLGNVFSTVGEIRSALAEMVRLLEIAEASGVDSRLAHAYYMYSVGSSSTGDWDEANVYVAKAHEVGRRSGSPTDLASASVAQGFATRHDDEAALEAFATADRLARSAGNRWMSAFARTEASGLLVAQGDVVNGCAGLADVVDVWYRSGEWAQQWHTLSRCLIGLDRIGQNEIAAQVLGAIDAHTAMGGPPVMSTLRDLAFETRDSVTARLGQTRTDLERAAGASLPVATLVGRVRNALLGRAIDG
ncbi:MAG: winged helix-turn-helix domain-containing protein [Ilumatobacteraceae bacterium]